MEGIIIACASNIGEFYTVRWGYLDGAYFSSLIFFYESYFHTCTAKYKLPALAKMAT
jgi:hypothetical protein